jgi:chromosomal replication initiation ATPase DnaA
MQTLLPYKAPRSIQDFIIPEIEQMISFIQEKYKIHLVVNVDFKNKELALQEFRNDLCRELGVTWHDIVGSRGKSNICEARFIYIYLRYVIYKDSPKAIGKELDRDRTTIIHALQAIEDRIHSNDQVFMSRLNILIDKYVKCQEV